MADSDADHAVTARSRGNTRHAQSAWISTAWRGLPPRSDSASRRRSLLASRAGPAASAEQRQTRRAYDIVCCVTTEDRCGRRGGTAQAFPSRHPIRRFCAERGDDCDRLAARAAYDTTTVERLAGLPPGPRDARRLPVAPHRADAVAFPRRIVNVHHSDLRLRDRPGARFPGLRAVRDAILAGERATRGHRAPRHPRTRRRGRPCCVRGRFRCRRSWLDAVARGATDVLRRTATRIRSG